MIVCGGLVSMRKSTLKVFGGELHSLWDTPRMDSGRRSRSAAHVCRKDWQASGRRDYKPWQTTEIIGLSEALASNDPQLQDWQDFFWETPSMEEDLALDWDEPNESMYWMFGIGGWNLNDESVSWEWTKQQLACEESRWDDQQESCVAYDYLRVAGIIAGEIEADESDSWLFNYIPESCYLSHDESLYDSMMNDPDDSYFSDDSDDSFWWCPKFIHKDSPAAKNARELDLSIEEYQALCEPCLEDILF
jgi:hypothetical protein